MLPLGVVTTNSNWSHKYFVFRNMCFKQLSGWFQPWLKCRDKAFEHLSLYIQKHLGVVTTNSNWSNKNFVFRNLCFKLLSGWFQPWLKCRHKAVAGNCIATFYIWCDDNRKTFQEFSSAHLQKRRMSAYCQISCI